VDPDILRERFQMTFQIIANTERRSGRVWKEERLRIIAIWVPPQSTPQSLVRGQAALEIIALRCLCLADPILPFLALLQRYVDSELRSPPIPLTSKSTGSPSGSGSAPWDLPELKAAVARSAMAAVYAPSIQRATRSGWVVSGLFSANPR